MSLRSELRTAKGAQVDYAYIAQIHQHYVDWKAGSETAEASFETLKKMCVPLANSYLSRSNNIFHYDGGNEMFDELFSWAYVMIVELLYNKELEFEDEKRMYVYFDKRITFGILTEYRKLTKHDDVNESLSEDSVLQEIESIPQDDFTNAMYEDRNDELYLKHLEFHLQRFNEDDASMLFCIVERVRLHYMASNIVRRIRPSDVAAHLATQGFIIDKKHFLTLFEKGVTLHKLCSYLSVSERSSVGLNMTYASLTEVHIDKLFLFLLLSEERFPNVVELYGVLGERFLEFVEVLGSRKITVPSHRDLMKAELESEIFLALAKDGATLDGVAKEFNVTEKDCAMLCNAVVIKLHRFTHLRELIQKVEAKYVHRIAKQILEQESSLDE